MLSGNEAVLVPWLERLFDRLPYRHAAIRGTPLGYVLALLLVGFAWLSRSWVGPAEIGLPLLTFFSASALATIALGIGPGLLAALVGGLVACYVYMPPYGQFSFEFAPANVASLLIYFVDEALIVLVVLALHRYFERYRANRELLNAILESTPDVIHVRDAQGRYRYVNAAAARRAGKRASEMLGTASLEAAWPVPPEETEKLGSLEYTMTTAAGERRTYLATRGPLCDAQGEQIGLFAIERDITALRRADEQLQMAAQVFQMSTEGIMVTDDRLRISAINPAFTRMTGYTAHEAIGQTPALLQSGRHDEDFYQSMWKQLEGQGHWEGEIWNRRKDGQLFLEWLSINALRDEQGRARQFIGVFRDITITRDAQSRMTWLATHDELTGLPNRTLLHDQLHRTVARAARGGKKLVMLLIDVDNFKIINDTLGLAAGDALLKQMASRLIATVREADLIARLGGDEFAILLEDAGEEAESVLATAHRLLDALSAPATLAGQECFPSACIGISLFPEDASDATELLQHADTALVRARAAGRNTLQFFSEEMGRHTRERLELESGLRRALIDRELYLEYQPQVDLHDRTLIGVEALVRWRQGERVIPPVHFIPLAEESHLIVEIGEWVIEEACRQLQSWKSLGLGELTVSVNIAARHFLQTNMVERVHAIVQTAGLSASQLCLEITEGAMQDADAASAKLRELHALGFATSVDDFGTGFSSLSHLKRFPLHELKIDRSFVSGIVEDKDDHAITSAIIAMADNLSLRVVAEGIETHDQLEELKSLGCRIGQGYLFSRPIPGKQIPDWLKAQNGIHLSRISSGESPEGCAS